MCGIVGYIGKDDDPRVGIRALRRLEYRGYDSAGIAAYDTSSKKVNLLRVVGRIDQLERNFLKSQFYGAPFIGHTRWATHGVPCVKNAHPHFDCKRQVFVVHNGIIENYQELKKYLLRKAHVFSSGTDTEVLAHLIEYHLGEANELEEAVHKTLTSVRGAYGLVVLYSGEPDKLVVARLSSPLIIGAVDGGYFVASDASAVVPHTKDVFYLDDGDVATITCDGLNIRAVNGNSKKVAFAKLSWNEEGAWKGGYEHFMLKEIMEQPVSLENTLRGRILARGGKVRLGGLDGVKERLKRIGRIQLVACGTASYAGLVGKYMLEEFAGIPCELDIGSEFRYRKPILDKDTAVIAISQSGETADTLAAVYEAQERGVLVLGIVNVVGSTIARETEAGIYNHAGPERSVASTKAFTSQLAVLALLAVFLGRQRSMSYATGKEITSELLRLPVYVDGILKNRKRIQSIARKYAKYKNFFYLGRGLNYPIALEGALKLKELSYVHAEGCASGEMKHGPIALIDKNFPTFAIVPQDSIYEKTISNIEEIRARQGPVIALTTVRNRQLGKIVDDVIYVPNTLEILMPLLTVIPLQLFAYYMAVFNGRDVDKPRNLAKSVTVE